LLDDIYNDPARKRQKSYLMRGPVVPNSERREEDKKENGRTIVKEAMSLGLGKDRLCKLKFIGYVSEQNDPNNPKIKEYENEKEYAVELLKELDNGNISYDAAYRKLKLMHVSNENEPESIQAAQILNRIEKGEKFRDNACKMYEQRIKNYASRNEGHTEAHSEIPLITYSVIVTDLTKFTVKEAKDSKFTEQKNAALFLWATESDVKERIDLLEKCNFILKSIGIWKKDANFVGTYFQGKVEFLLLGIRGNIENSDFKPQIILNNKNTTDKNKSYEIIEKIFPTLTLLI
jgi:hypothetical protein